MEYYINYGSFGTYNKKDNNVKIITMKNVAMLSHVYKINRTNNFNFAGFVLNIIIVYNFNQPLNFFKMWNIFCLKKKYIYLKCSWHQVLNKKNIQLSNEF